MAGVELTSPGRSIRLWNGQESLIKAEGNIKMYNVSETESDESLLTSFERRDSIEYTGLATGNRIAAQEKYSDDPREALSEWVAELDSFLGSGQGEGYELIDPNRERSYNGVLSSLTWKGIRGAIFEVEWSLELFRGGGLMPETNLEPQSVTPRNKAFLGGQDLGSLKQWQVSKRQPFELFPIAGPNSSYQAWEYLPKGGAVREISITGEISGKQERREFDETLRSMVGRNQVHTYESHLGLDFDMMIETYDSVRSAGQTRLGEYHLTLIEGEE